MAFSINSILYRKSGNEQFLTYWFRSRKDGQYFLEYTEGRQQMKFSVYFFGCLFILFGSSSCFINVHSSNEHEINGPKDVLVKVSEKLDQWDRFFANQPDFLQLITKVNDLQKNIQSCNTQQNFQAPGENLTQLKTKIGNLNSKFETVNKNVESVPLQSSSLKSLEKKLSRLQYSLDRSLLRNGLANLKKFDEKSNHGINDIFMDISSKVDALYDKSLSEPTFENSNDLKHMGRSCRMLVGPYKKLLSSVDHLQEIFKDLGLNNERAIGKGEEIRNSVMLDIRERLENIYDEIRILGKRNEKNINENERILRRMEKKLDSELEDDDDDDEKLKKSLKKYMIEQRKILESTLKKILKGKNGNNDDDDDDDDGDDDDTDTYDGKKKNKKHGKSKDTDTENDDDDDDDDNDDDDHKHDKDNDDDDDDGDDLKCDDSDENGSKSCEKRKTKAYSRGKKKSKYYRRAGLYDNNDDDNDADLKNKKKVRKSLDIEEVEDHNPKDKLVADGPWQNEMSMSFGPPEGPDNKRKIPDTTP